MASECFVGVEPMHYEKVKPVLAGLSKLLGSRFWAHRLNK